MLRRLSIHLLLACFLLVTQQLASAHGMTHPLKGGVPDTQSCHTCMLAAQIGGPLSTCAVDFTTWLRYQSPAFIPGNCVAPPPPCAFHSRAPPHVL